MTQFTQKLFVLEASGGGRLFSINPDGSGKTVLVGGCPVPDGVAVDVEAGHVYWTNMGTPPVNDGSIERADLDGGNRTTIVPRGGTYTPKQLHLDVHGPQAVLVRPRRHAGDALRPRRVQRGDPRRRPATATTTAATRPNGASESPSTTSAGTCTGRRRDQVTQASAGFCGPGSTFPQANPPRTVVTSRWCSRTCPSRSTSKSTTPHGRCTGPTGVTRHTATPSIGPPCTTSAAPNPRSWRPT